MADWIPKAYYTIRLDGIPLQRIAVFLRNTLGLSEDQLLHDNIADYASISCTFDNEPLFEIRKGDAQ